MTKYGLFFVVFLLVTLANVYFFGLRQPPEAQSPLVREQVKSPPARADERLAAGTARTESLKSTRIEPVQPVEMRVWRETEYTASAYSIPAKPAERQRAKPAGKKPAKPAKGAKVASQAVVSNGIKYVKIPFKGKYIYVSTDYYMVDGVRTPLSLKQAQKVARKYGAVLPTREMVDAIWRHADLKLKPQPLQAGPLMTKPVYYFKHNAMIEKQINNREYRLVAGHKKDIIRPQRKGRVTLYGWHRLNGVPIQPPSNVHDDDYGDYSNCLRLVRLPS
jgi:hypothetical protein